MGVIDFIFALIQDMLLSAIPAVGFAMVFNVPHRALPWCALLGALGHGSRMVMMTAGLNIEWSPFMASLLVCTPESLHRCGSDPYVSWDLRLHCHDIRRKDRSFRL